MIGWRRSILTFSDGTTFKVHKSLLNHVSYWIKGILQGLKECDEDTQRRLLETAGKCCALRSSVPIVSNIAKEESDEKRRLEKVKEIIHFPNIHLEEKQGETFIRVEYTEEDEPCICPLVQYGIIDEMPLLCECTRGWLKNNFEALLQKPVTVSLEKSALRGDKYCSFIVYPTSS